MTGWEGQFKGLLQVLCERGLIKTKVLDKYTLDGQKDTITGKVDLLHSLQHLLVECTDFKHEEMALQYLGTQLGVTVQLTPKCHAELAGEGIEHYIWACSKGAYRNLSLKEKKGKENFNASVRQCCLSEQIVTVRRIRKFARCACQYLLAFWSS